jgi:predicted RNA binding protein YcfA (HicA-like mRNA interferase family)
MKLPRDISGDEAVRALVRLGFEVKRQSGSHIQMTNGVRHVTVPAHDPIRIGTLKSMLRQAGVELEDFVGQL